MKYVNGIVHIKNTIISSVTHSLVIPNMCDYLDSLLKIKVHHSEAIEQGCPNLVLEGRCPAEFSSNPNQTHLNQQIKVL